MVHYVPNYDQGKNEPTFVPGWLESRGIRDKFGIGRSIYLPGPYPQTAPVLSVHTAPIVLHWCGIGVPYWLSCINGRVVHDRIDENMDGTLTNVEGAQGQLLKYLNSISSNRWLMMKIFFVLMVFLMIFIFFVAW